MEAVIAFLKAIIFFMLPAQSLKMFSAEKDLFQTICFTTFCDAAGGNHRRSTHQWDKLEVWKSLPGSSSHEQ